MPLLEIITTDKTSKDIPAAAVGVSLKQGKTVIILKDAPGFYTIHCPAPMLAEAVALMQEGIKPNELDRITTKCDFPVGLAALAVEVGMDMAQHITKDLLKAFGSRMGGADIGVLNERVTSGFLGTAALAGIVAAICKFMRCERHCANGLHIVWVCGMQDTGDTPSPVQSSPLLADHATACHAVPGIERCFERCSDSDGYVLSYSGFR